MSRLPFHRSRDLLGVAAAAGVLLAGARSPVTEEPAFAISHRNSITEAWPFGLGDVTTKIVTEPPDAEDVAECYWLVRSRPAVDRPWGFPALRAVVSVRPEFPGTDFEPLAGRDFEIVTGVDRRGATTTEIEAGLFELRVPASEGAHQAGFALRARFPGDGDGPEPPRSLLVELERVEEDETGRVLPLGEILRARWLIVDPDSGPGRPARRSR